MEVLRKAFKQQLDPQVSKFVGCIDDDAHLIDADIQGSLAHVTMLVKTGLIDAHQYQKITQGLKSLQQQYAAGELHLKTEWEDVHMNVEKQLEIEIGKDALRLHTARSRNDQVAVDMRLYTREQTSQIIQLLDELKVALITIAEANSSVAIPGYTHLQRAQPLLFSHVVHAFAEMFPAMQTGLPTR
jgi:argininosuccinate lyase